MKCRDFQYKLNKTYSMNGDDINVCNCGFHLCLNLEDVFQYYGLNFSNRFFKVKALVKKVDKNNYGAMSEPPSYFSFGHKIDKIVAKKIVFLEELTFDECRNYCEILEILNKAIAYSKENLSKDMLVYLLMKDIKKITH
ncbi:hypothetical protein M1I50_09165 [Clostridioides difficile]|nr:hypothetical protein [Clostridioides difficile]MCL0943152.1 hypothetical protein [Clostridioides difficile]MDI2845671.1 hypothetical protein [Clostridioides difficile]